MPSENKGKAFDFDHSSSFFMKYFKIFIVKTPFENFSNYSHGLNKIFEELGKT
jgi:hypothetical protein